MVEGVALVLAGCSGGDSAVWDGGNGSADSLEDKSVVISLLYSDSFGQEMARLVCVSALVICAVVACAWILYWLKGDD